jgi:hypothetical protein
LIDVVAGRLVVPSDIRKTGLLGLSIPQMAGDAENAPDAH